MRSATLARMNSESLTPDQKARLLARITRDAVYYHRLMRRMEHLKWPRDDPVFRRTEVAAERLHDLRVYVEQVHETLGRPPFGG